jgi:hypothetical protein
MNAGHRSGHERPSEVLLRSLWRAPLRARAIELSVFLVFFVAGFLLFGSGLLSAYDELRYHVSGTETDATVIAKKSLPYGRRGTRPGVSYRFTTPDGRKAEGEGIIEPELLEKLRPDSLLSVTYLADEPSINRPRASSEWGAMLVAFPIGALSMALGGGLGWFILGPIFRMWRLVRVGVPAEGTVLGIESAAISFSRRVQSQIRYRYQDRLGGIHEGKSRPMDASDLEGWKPGARGAILYEPRRPDRSIWLGKT